MSKILLVDDDPMMLKLLAGVLKGQRHVVESALNGREALDKLLISSFDLIILDIMLPDQDGISVCREYRRNGGLAAILMLTSIGSSESAERGLDTGADDYLKKPFEVNELCARVRALLRRTASHNKFGDCVQVRNLCLDIRARKLLKAGCEIHLLPREFALLEFFMRNQGEVFSADALIERVWQSDTLASCDSVRSHVKSLRKKIDDLGQRSIIRTIHGQGYSFEP